METINITLKLPEDQVIKFRLFIEMHCEDLVEFKILPNTDAMYEADDTFKALLKERKKTKNIVEKYINDNNNKYK